MLFSFGVVTDVKILLLRFFQILFFSALLLAPALAKSIPVLGLHDIVLSPLPAYRQAYDSDYELADLRFLLESLIGRGYTFITPAQYLLCASGKACPAKPLMLSFDDGYEGLYRQVLPLLEELKAHTGQQVQVVLFVIPGLFGADLGGLRYLNCQELKIGAERGYFRVESHSQTHPKLTELNDLALTNQLSTAQAEIKACLGDQQAGEFLAYPYGASDQRVEEASRKFYQAAFRYDNKISDLGANTDLYRLSRLQVHGKLSPKEILRHLP